MRRFSLCYRTALPGHLPIKYFLKISGSSIERKLRAHGFSFVVTDKLWASLRKVSPVAGVSETGAASWDAAQFFTFVWSWVGCRGLDST